MDLSKLVGEGFAEMGEFWAVENQEERRAGILRIGNNDKITLEVYPDFSVCDFRRRVSSGSAVTSKIINGQLKNGQIVTLVNCLYLSRGVWVADFLLKEVSARAQNPTIYEDVSCINFKKARITFTNWKKWLPRQVQPRYDTDSEKIIAELPSSAPEHKIMDGNIILGYRWGISREESSFAAGEYIEFSFEDRKNFKEHMDLAGYFSGFLTLCLGTVVDIEKICLLDDNWNDAVQLVYQRRKSVYENKVSNNSRIFSYKTLKDDFASYIDNWYSIGVAEDTRVSLAMFMESYEHSVPLEITFLLLVQSWEGMAKQKYFKETGKISGKSLKEIIMPLLEKVSFIMPDFINIKHDALADKIVKSRHYYTHNSGKYTKPQIFDIDALFVITILMRFMIRIWLLLEAGICENKIKQVLGLGEPHRFKYLIGTYIYDDLEVLCNNLTADVINN